VTTLRPVAGRLRVIGPGRAGGALTIALRRAGWEIAPPVVRGDSVADAAVDVDVLAVTTPDGVIAEVAARVRPEPATLVVHCSGALTLDALWPHERRASLHPLAPLPSAEEGADRLVGAWFAVAGDGGVDTIVEALDGRPFRVEERDRVLYHAAAAIASNHLVGLVAQAQRLGGRAGAPPEAFLDLARAALDTIGRSGPAAAITGPIQRGDWATVRRHIEALEGQDRQAYEAMAHQVAQLVRGRGASR
jgi:predicted short-subunit dehydrogenase-like oxidoreductase (DUF2520 family)